MKVVYLKVLPYHSLPEFSILHNEKRTKGHWFVEVHDTISDRVALSILTHGDYYLNDDKYKVVIEKSFSPLRKSYHKINEPTVYFSTINYTPSSSMVVNGWDERQLKFIFPSQKLNYIDIYIGEDKIQIVVDNLPTQNTINTLKNLKHLILNRQIKRLSEILDCNVLSLVKAKGIFCNAGVKHSKWGAAINIYHLMAISDHICNTKQSAGVVRYTEEVNTCVL